MVIDPFLRPMLDGGPFITSSSLVKYNTSPSTHVTIQYGCNCDIHTREHSSQYPCIGSMGLVHPWKINIEPENDGLEDDFPFPGGPYSQVPAVNLPGCIFT